MPRLTRHPRSATDSAPCRYCQAKPGQPCRGGPTGPQPRLMLAPADEPAPMGLLIKLPPAPKKGSPPAGGR